MEVAVRGLEGVADGSVFANVRVTRHHDPHHGANPIVLLNAEVVDGLGEDGLWKRKSD